VPKHVKNKSKGGQLPIFIHRSHNSMAYSNKIWDDPEIQRAYPNYIFTCVINEKYASLLIKIWSIKSVNTQNGLVYKSEKDITLRVFGQDRVLHWTSHSIQRIIERTDNNYVDILNVSCAFYFLDWFKITAHNNKLYILLYIPSNNNNATLVGAAPLAIVNDKLVAKTYLPPHYCKKIWSDYDEDIEIPENYNLKRPDKNDELKWHCANFSKGKSDAVWHSYC
jgi:hypothetical protein